MSEVPCKKCGKPTTTGQGRLCPDCLKFVLAGSRTTAEHNYQAKLAKQPKASDSALDIFGGPLVLSGCFLILLLLLAVVFTLTKSQPSVIASLLLAAQIVCIIVATMYWAVLWARLMAENAVLAIVCFFLPFGVYRVLITHPEKNLGTFFMHAIFGILAFGIFLLRLKLFPPTTILAY